MKLKATLAHWPLALLFAPLGAAVGADNITFSDVPLFIVSPVKANMMVILDNSQSMDGTMAGKLVAGNDLTTRGNIARDVLRTVITNSRDKINWGLTAFETSTPALRDTHAYYMGDQNTMVFTDDCAAALAADTNRKGCIEIPGAPTATGSKRYVTFAQSGDSPSINDVLYTDPGSAPDVMYGTGAGGSAYRIYGSRDANQDWANANFGAQPFGLGPINFTPTDAGFVPSAGATPSVTRQVWIKEGWGFRGPITGRGDIREQVQTDSTGHFNRLQALLQNEEISATSSEIKNAALFTPLAGALQTVKNYFDGGSSPINPALTCQKNYAVLATDGIPTGRTDGSEYTIAERTNTKVGAAPWQFGQAQRDVFAQIQALRNDVRISGDHFPVETFVIGMGGSFGPGNPLADSSLAALNRMAELGRDGGTAFIGDDRDNLAQAFDAIVDLAKNEGRSGSGVALNSGAFNSGSALYQAKFNGKKWSGALLKYAAPNGVISTTPAWNAGDILKARTAPRNILTYKPSAAVLGERGVVFRWPADPAVPTANEIDIAQSAEINKAFNGTADGNGAARLAWLRGDTSNSLFRSRADGPLGDIVNSAPVFVAGPAFGYANDFESASYGAFAAANKDRTKVVYVGANDGMLHAFDADNGTELFAYAPTAVYPTFSKLSSPSYIHRYSVDGTPTVGDVFYGGSWHTLLVSGMRAGGKGLFALDVTNPGAFNEAGSNPKAVVRWEFQDATDMGFVFGQPLLVKTNNAGKWAVIAAGGYGNASGNGVLFVIDAEDGRLIRKLDTGSGLSNGLSGPSAIDTNGDGVVDLVYAGDLNGNLWKFDLTSTNKDSWVVGNAGNVLFTAGTTKPITSAPDVTRHPKGGYLIGFGPGRYIATTDNANTTGQTIYAIWDKLIDGTVTVGNLQQQVVADTTTSGGVDFRLTSHVIAIPADTSLTGVDTPSVSRDTYFTTKRGWYLNLPDTGERVVSDVAFRNGRLIAVSIIPATTCPELEAGGSGWLMELDAITGNRLDVVTFDISGEGVLKAGLVGSGDYLRFSISGAAGNNVSGQKIDGLPSGQTTVTKTKDTESRLFTTSKGTLEEVTTGRGAGRDGRAMWREVR